MCAPNLFIPGFQKCGTASLHNLIKEHPSIFVPRFKPHFFSNSRTYYQTVNDYLNIYRNPGENIKYLADTSDSYIVDYNAIKFMRNTLGENIYFIILLRNPVHRIYSAYAHMRRPRIIGEARDFNELIDINIKTLTDLIKYEYNMLQKAERKKRIYPYRQRQIWGDNYLWNFRYIYNSVYSIHIENLKNLFPQSRFKFIILEKLSNNLRYHLSKIYEFLEIDCSIAYEQPIFHKNKNLYLTLDMSKKTIKYYQFFSSRLLEKFPYSFIKYGLSKIENFFLCGKIPNKMPRRFESYLNKLFSYEIRNIEDLLQIDLTVWKDTT